MKKKIQEIRVNYIKCDINITLIIKTETWPENSFPDKLCDVVKKQGLTLDECTFEILIPEKDKCFMTLENIIDYLKSCKKKNNAMSKLRHSLFKQPKNK